jgi:hypothetical protein
MIADVNLLGAEHGGFLHGQLTRAKGLVPISANII